MWNVSFMAFHDFWIFVVTCAYVFTGLNSTCILSVFCFACLFPKITLLPFHSHHSAFFPPGCCASAPCPHSSSCFSSPLLCCLPRRCLYVWQAGANAMQMRDVWRCNTMAYGARCVMMRWILIWPMWCVDSWASNVAWLGRTVPSLERDKVNLFSQAFSFQQKKIN